MIRLGLVVLLGLVQAAAIAFGGVAEGFTERAVATVYAALGVMALALVAAIVTQRAWAHTAAFASTTAAVLAAAGGWMAADMSPQRFSRLVDRSAAVVQADASRGAERMIGRLAVGEAYAEDAALRAPR